MCSQTGGFPVLLQLTSPCISHLCIWIAYVRFSSPTFWFSLGTYFPLQPELDLWRVWLYQSLVVARQEGRSWASAFLFIGFVFLSCSETHNHPLQCYYIAIKWTKDKNFLLSSHAAVYVYMYLVTDNAISFHRLLSSDLPYIFFFNRSAIFWWGFFFLS